jgi:hypothetical protein
LLFRRHCRFRGGFEGRLQLVLSVVVSFSLWPKEISWSVQVRMSFGYHNLTFDRTRKAKFTRIKKEIARALYLPAS